MKKLLLTGGTGFVGRNIKPLLEKQYEVSTLGRNAENDIWADISHDIVGLPDKYDIVIHAAGRAHTFPRTDEEIQEYFDVNYQGTVNLCGALENCGLPELIVFLSSAAVYGLNEGVDIDETCPLRGTTPYAQSKIKAEDYLMGWCEEHHVRLCILRPSLITGPNPPGNLGAMMKGISTGRYLGIGEGNARKSLLMVQDIARIIPLLENRSGIYNICSDDQPSFKELETAICHQLNKRLPLHIPIWTAKGLAKVGDLFGRRAPFNSNKLMKMTRSLTFCNEKAKTELGWVPLSVMDNFIIK